MNVIEQTVVAPFEQNCQRDDAVNFRFHHHTTNIRFENVADFGTKTNQEKKPLQKFEINNKGSTFENNDRKTVTIVYKIQNV